MKLSDSFCARGRVELTALLLLAVAAAAGFGGWQLAHRHVHTASPAGERKVAFYQSPMHPWIKSDKPGNCTICGMKLVPVYEGEKGLDQDAPTAGIRLGGHTLSVISVATSPVVRQPIRRTIRVAGMIDDDDSRHRRLSAYIDGRIEKLHINSVGAEVSAGSPLAGLYSRDLIIGRGEYVLATKMPAGPDRDNAIGATRQKLRRMGLTAQQVEALPAHVGDTFEILAPISGTVVQRNVYEGQYVKEGDVLFEIADFSKMWFVFDAYERDIGWIRVGQNVEIIAPSVPGKVFRAPVVFIDPNLAAESRTARVRVVLENPHDHGRRELLHKVYAEGRVAVESEEVLTIPRSAVLSADGSRLVYVEKGLGRYEARSVLLGRAGDDVWEVLDGLSEDDRVVTTGNLLVDSQAQLESGGHTTAPPAMVLSDAQRAAAKDFISAVVASGRALAADDLAAHNATLGKLGETASALGAFAPDVARLGGLKPSENLPAARTAFYPLSMAASAFATQLRKAGDAAEVHIFECPMVKSAVPSAETSHGRWLQFDAPLRNPFFGAEMLECGKEVAP
jgi:membrane fusion protein, copper/silver efflux system